MADWLKIVQQYVVDQLRQDVIASGCAALLGEFRMGKTSTLEILRDLLPPPVVLVSLSPVADTKNAAPDLYFYTTILGSLRSQSGSTTGGDPFSDCLDDLDRYESFERTLQKLAQQPVTILLDDADRLLVEDWSKRVFQKLRRLVEAKSVRVVLAGTSRLERQAEKLRYEAGRAGLWNLIRTPRVLQPIPPQAVYDNFINHPGLPEKLIELCGGHPYCLRTLTQDLPLFDLSPERLLSEVDELAQRRQSEWNEMFRRYFQDYDKLSRQVCYRLAITNAPLAFPKLKAELSQATESELKTALNILCNTGILFENREHQLSRLIELFRRWYLDETGTVQTISPELKVETRGGRTDSVELRTGQDISTTELTFVPDKNLVLIRRDRFFFRHDLDVPPNRLLVDIPEKTRQQSIDINGQLSPKGLQLLSRDLWAELRDSKWLQDVLYAVRAHSRLRFIIPVGMGEFPFEPAPTGRNRYQTDRDMRPYLPATVWARARGQACPAYFGLYRTETPACSGGRGRGRRRYRHRFQWTGPRWLTGQNCKPGRPV